MNLFVDLRRKDGRVIPVLATIVRTEGPGGPYLEGQFIDASGLDLEVGAVRSDEASTREPHDRARASAVADR